MKKRFNTFELDSELSNPGGDIGVGSFNVPSKHLGDSTDRFKVAVQRIDDYGNYDDWFHQEVVARATSSNELLWYAFLFGKFYTDRKLTSKLIETDPELAFKYLTRSMGDHDLDQLVKGLFGS